MQSPSRVVIIGGGIAGLAAAYRLERVSPDSEVVLLEQSARLGGIVTTERSGGFVIEGGPDSFLSSKPRGIGLCAELGITDRLEGTRGDRRRTFVMREGELHGLPEGLSGLVPGRIEPLLESSLFSPQGKQRLAEEPDIPPRTDEGDESLASFMRRRFGEEVYDRLIEPLMAGIYAGDGAQLSLAATFPQLRSLELEYGSLLRGIAATHRPAAAPSRPAFLTPIGGMYEIVEALRRALRRTRVLPNHAARGLARTGLGYTVSVDEGETVRAEAVICAAPARVAAQLLAALDSDLAATLAEIPYASTATVSLGYREEDLRRPLDGYGYVVPRTEGRPVLASTWVSSKFSSRAPAGAVLIRMFIGRFGQEQFLAGGDGDLLELARQEAFSILGIAARPILSRVFRWPEAMPQYTLGHMERLRRIGEGLARHPRLFLAGNAYSGVGVPDCIRGSETAAEDAVAALTTISAT